jgi:ketosteroid isomerase-like protein
MFIVSTGDVVRACFASYLAQDREAAEALIAADFTFTSPQDDHIDRDAYFERCFPTVDRLRSQELFFVVEADDDRVFALYEYELRNGERYRNTELHTVRDGQVSEVQVFFGGRLA